MWRRILSPKTLTLASAAGKASSATAAAPLRSISAAARAPPLFSAARCFSADSVNTSPPKTVEDVMPIATGAERAEIEAELQGIDLSEIDNPHGPFGTEEAPAIVKSFYDKRIVGCPGDEGDDEHDVVWFWLKKGKPHICPVCSQYFMLEVVGPGGPPPGEEDDDHHH